MRRLSSHHPLHLCVVRPAQAQSCLHEIRRNLEAKTAIQKFDYFREMIWPGAEKSPATANNSKRLELAVARMSLRFIVAPWRPASRPKPLPVLGRDDEAAHHLGIDVVAVEDQL